MGYDDMGYVWPPFDVITKFSLRAKQLGASFVYHCICGFLSYFSSNRRKLIKEFLFFILRTYLFGET